MSNKFKVGDKVKWNSPQGETNGKITKVIGSKDDARYEVESEKTNKKATHKEDALTKI